MMKQKILVLVISVTILSLSQTAKGQVRFRWFDEYSKVTALQETFHLDNFGIYLMNDPELLGYMAFRAGVDDTRKKVIKRAEKNRQYIANKFKISKSRIRLIYLGKRDKTYFVLQPLKPTEKFPVKRNM